MNITPKSILQHELIGLNAHVARSRDPTHVSQNGRIVGESKSLLQLETKSGDILLPKEVCTFDITLPNKTVVRVDGNLLQGRPEERMKKRHRRRW